MDCHVYHLYLLSIVSYLTIWVCVSGISFIDLFVDVIYHSLRLLVLNQLHCLVVDSNFAVANRVFVKYVVSEFGPLRFLIQQIFFF